MSIFSGITDVEIYHNPNEGRVIINENFRKMISGVTESVGLISGGTGVTVSTLSEVLMQGNETGPSNIIISSGQTLSSSVGGGQINLRAGGNDGKVLITSDGGVENESGFYVDSQYAYMFNSGYNKGFYLGIEESEWWNQDVNEDNQSIKITIGSGKPFVAHNNTNNNRFLQGSNNPTAVGLNTYNALFLSGVNNSVIVGGASITATTDNTVYVPNLNINTAPLSGSVSDQFLVRSSDGTIKTIDQPQYVEYLANLTQTGTSAPSATILGSATLSDGSWSYSDIGSYFFTKTGAFSAATKVEVDIQGVQVLSYTMANAAFNLISASVYDNNTIEVRTAFFGSYPISSTTYSVLTSGAGGLSASSAMSNDILDNTRFSLKVWS